MDPRVMPWLWAQLGVTTDEADLTRRYARLGTARAVVGEVLAERRAKLLAEPLRLTVDGVVTLDQSNNLAGLERQLATLEELVAPDDPISGEPGVDLVTAPIVHIHRAR
ncbi:hypothetical protein ACIBCO_09960 [Streptomyces violascens]|uniref:hypothetical protein n=1 Tax=Streptomyces violascens TaxID=67381 RepID=UPI0037A9D1D7